MGYSGPRSYDDDRPQDCIGEIPHDYFLANPNDPDDFTRGGRELTDEGKANAYKHCHESYDPDDWYDPGVVVWLVEKDAFVPLPVVRTILEVLQRCLHEGCHWWDLENEPRFHRLEDDERLAIGKEVELLQRRLAGARPLKPDSPVSLTL